MALLDKNTLGYQLGFRPATTRVSRAGSSLPNTVAALNQYMGGKFSTFKEQGLQYPQKLPPEAEAVEFYLYNHAMAVLKGRRAEYEPLSKDELELVEGYHTMLALQSTRMFYYLLLICTRESRHEKGLASLWSEVADKYGQDVITFHNKIKGTGSSSAAEALRTSPPMVTLGLYTDYLCTVFFKGSFSSGYGGKAWGAVAKVLRDYVHGVLSAEMMMDTSFTLCHNNGPIFNKGMLFDNYSSFIYKILDVQRAGQMPQLVHQYRALGEKMPIDGSANSRAQTLLSSIAYTLGADVIGAGYVDWVGVESLGALKTYSVEKSAQASVALKVSKFLGVKPAKEGPKLPKSEAGGSAPQGESYQQIKEPAVASLDQSDDDYAYEVKPAPKTPTPVNQSGLFKLCAGISMQIVEGDD